jgi:hypothetical protein
MPPTKELHYFDRSEDYGSPSYLGMGPSVVGRLINSRDYRRRVAQALYYGVTQPSLERIRWDLRYLGGTPGDAWYQSLFEPGRGKLTGEITPAYSMLSATDVAHVAALLPEAKILFLIRNPVDRAWSAFQYGKKFKGSTMSRIDANELLAVTEQPWFSQRADYVHTLKNWGRHFSPDQFFVGFFDEIKENPQALLGRVFDFLGLDKNVDVTQWGMDKRVNASRTEKMPPEIRRSLAEKYRPMACELASQLGGYATKWLDDIDRILAQPSSR